jgi:hypothetical protein
VTVGAGGAIGLNEVALGIPVPKYWAGVMVQVRAFGGTSLFQILQGGGSSCVISYCSCAKGHVCVGVL